MENLQSVLTKAWHERSKAVWEGTGHGGNAPSRVLHRPQVPRSVPGFDMINDGLTGTNNAWIGGSNGAFGGVTFDEPQARFRRFPHTDQPYMTMFVDLCGSGVNPFPQISLLPLPSDRNSSVFFFAQSPCTLLLVF